MGVLDPLGEFAISFLLCYTIQTSSGGTTKHTARYVCHPPTFVGG